MAVALMTNLNSGFAVAGGDAGHLASLNNQGSGAPDTYISYLHNRDQVTAWIHDAIALFTPAARAVVKGYYGKEASHSYYDGCSTGGAQGFALAQYHPDLFDGIIAGSPGNWYSHLALSFLWNAQRTQSNSSFLSQAALNLTTAAVLKACDALDGVADGVVENPLLCDFQLSTLACNSSAVANNSTCLTPDQIEAAKAIYAGPTNAETGAQLYPGFSPGSEIEWILQEGDLASAFAVPILQNLVYNDLNYNPSTFDWAGDVKDVDEKAGAFIDEISVNLTAFRNRGGKMIVTQGYVRGLRDSIELRKDVDVGASWADPFNAATWPIEHMERIQTFFGGDISDFFNLFMIPGTLILFCFVPVFLPHQPTVGVL
ncbi:hypothetical protein H2203_006722 [Taxawa tesnikishii (nom. ined.)]|nr:hypothetical protein H2203_006722 [Dothideales sp. JES 119]